MILLDTCTLIFDALIPKRLSPRARQALEHGEATTETRGKEYAAVNLSWSGPGGQGTASCYYNYDAIEDTALALADPLSPFSTSPSKMLFNGSALSRPDLAETVTQAMLKQGRSLIDAAKNALK